jgi:toxin ParE1/3/4
LSRAAERDLVEIGLFTEERWGVPQRMKYLGELEQRFDRLGRDPEQGRLQRDLGFGLRSQRQGRHLVIYSQTADGVLILRVLHERMDPGRHLAEEAE